MPVITKKITGTVSFVRPEITYKGNKVIFRDLNIIANADLDYRSDEDNDILILPANTPLTVKGQDAFERFPFELRNGGDIQIMIK